MNKHLSASKIAEQLLLRPEGATMDEIIAATGGAQYNVLRRLRGRGYAVRRVKEGNRTRYFGARESDRAIIAAVNAKGQVTLPKDVREALHLLPGQAVRFVVTPEGEVKISPARQSVQRLFGILGKPPRSATLEEIDKAREEAAVERYLKAIGRS